MGVSVVPGAILAGRYRIDAPIGAGGFGAVFRGVDLHLGTPVALKILLEGAVESGARFRREAELAMRLSHPNTVRTLDAGEDPDVGSYIVLELLEGGSLEQVLRAQGPFAPPLAAEMMLAVLASLREAHGLGIVHRDIKPANVFLLRAPATGVKVLDFGIAKSTNEGTRAGLTRDGQTIGTPAYMAPEQVTGGELGPETDLYAVGLVLAEAASGRPVYATDNGLAVLVEKLNGASPSLPASVAGSPLEAIVRRATRPSREQRYRTADEMIRALEGAIVEMSGGRSGPVLASSQGRTWGTESAPFPAPSATEVGAADTFGFDVAAPRPSSSSSPSLGEVSAHLTSPSQLASSPSAFAATSAPWGATLGAAQPGPPAPTVAHGPSQGPPGTGYLSQSQLMPRGPSPMGPQAGVAPFASAPPPAAPAGPPGPPFHAPYDPRLAMGPMGPMPPPMAPTRTSSGLGLGCLVLGLVGFLGVLGLLGAGALWFVMNDGPDGATTTAAPRAPQPPTPAPGVASPGVMRPAAPFACPGLARLDASNINMRVHAAAGFAVQDQMSETEPGTSSVMMTLLHDGQLEGRLHFMDGAPPGTLAIFEATREPEEPDAIYATSGAKLLFITLPASRAQTLVTSLCRSP